MPACGRILEWRAAPVKAEIIDRVLAVVGGVVITQSDVTAAAELGLVTVGASEDPIGVVLAQLISRQLVLTEVERYAPPEPTADAIERRLDAVRAKFSSTQDYTAALARSGLDDRASAISCVTSSASTGTSTSDLRPTAARR